MTSVLKMCIAQEVCVLDVFICLLVCLSAEWHQNNRTDSHETWIEGRSRPRTEPHINVWLKECILDLAQFP